jgi:hypothetical protein
MCPKAKTSVPGQAPYELWWNDATGACDWPCKVGCNKAVYGTSKSAKEIASQDTALNIDECRQQQQNLPINYQPSYVVPKAQAQYQTSYLANDEPEGAAVTTTPEILSASSEQSSSSSSNEEPVAAASISASRENRNGIVIKDQPAISSEAIASGALPDETVLCRSIGLVASLKYCNVYYNCKQYGQAPVEAFHCTDSAHFDAARKVCRLASNQPGGQCTLSPPLMYPYVSLAEIIPPEEFACSNQVGAYIIHSNVYCNIYYSCDGRLVS